MEIGSIFLVGLLSVIIAEIPDRYFERLPAQAAPFVPLVLRYAGFAAMIGDFSINYLHNDLTISVYLLLVIVLAVVWILRSVDDIRHLSRQMQRVTYATAGSMYSNFFIIIGITIALGSIPK